MKKRERNLLKDHGDNNREELWIESRSQPNKATGLRRVIPQDRQTGCFPLLDVTVT